MIYFRKYHWERGSNVKFSTSHLNGCETKAGFGCNGFSWTMICLQQHVRKHRDLIPQSCYTNQTVSINEPVRSSLTQQSNGVRVCINKLFKRIMRQSTLPQGCDKYLNDRESPVSGSQSQITPSVQTEVTGAQKRQQTSFPSSFQIHVEESVTVPPVALAPVQRCTDGPEQNVRLGCCSFTKSKYAGSLFPFI